MREHFGCDEGGSEMKTTKNLILIGHQVPKDVRNSSSLSDKKWMEIYWLSNLGWHRLQAGAHVCSSDAQREPMRCVPERRRLNQHNESVCPCSLEQTHPSSYLLFAFGFDSSDSLFCESKSFKLYLKLFFLKSRDNFKQHWSKCPIANSNFD